MPKWQDSVISIFHKSADMVTESKIEDLFISSFIACRAHLLVPEYISPKTQVRVGQYRIDWSAELRNGKRLAVELDGHDFHEKTKEQASKDKRKDRHLISCGYTVIRFSGSDVWNDPFFCCREVADHLHILEYGKSLKQSKADAGLAAIRELFKD